MIRYPHRRGRLPLRMARLFLFPNELRRSSERLEAAVLAGLATALAAAAVTAALLAAHVYRAEQAAALTGLWRTSAVLAPPGAVGADFHLHQAVAQATWRLSDGTERSGVLTSALAPGLYDEPAGATVLVWVDRAGTPKPPPLGGFDLVLSAMLAGLTVLIGAGGVLFCCYRLCRRALDRRRLASWTSAWAVTGPRWTQRR
jgi:hypothetical protein